ncbi:MAG: class I SAM-dependent methyltransferase [Desulfobulbaceae bacterium]|nr:class I SAM-dependent methyltransferase [Desulfobulbaceae bacterium]
MQNETYGFIFNQLFDKTLIAYDTDYQNEQAFSKVFRGHLEDVTKIISQHFSGKSLLEVGCGKGYFLELLQRAGFEIIGIDPAYEGINPKIIKDHFKPSLNISTDGIILRHTLEHIPDPISFLSAIAQANGNKGIIYIEVPCFDWICNHKAWTDIFYEHVNYFRLADFQRIFSKIYDSGHIFGGQYLYIIADINSLRYPSVNHKTDFTFPDDFLSNLSQIATIAKGHRNTIWGGAAKGVIFAHYMHKMDVKIGSVIDINPAKQGKFIAGTGIKVSSPDEGINRLTPGDILFVMNPNYLEEIKMLTNNQFNYTVV